MIQHEGPHFHSPALFKPSVWLAGRHALPPKCRRVGVRAYSGTILIAGEKFDFLTS
jgi:hypothetical protein